MTRYFYDEIAIFEYFGIQRAGKTTLMCFDLTRLLNPFNGWGFKPNDVYCNFHFYIDGVNILTNKEMLELLAKLKRDPITNIIIAIDEASQPPMMYARNTRDNFQTNIVTSFWQYPKLRRVLLYCDNPGNSVDIQMRDATWFTVAPLEYIRKPNREDDRLRFRVIHNYERWRNDYVLLNPSRYQKLFDTHKPVL